MANSERRPQVLITAGNDNLAQMVLAGRKGLPVNIVGVYVSKEESSGIKNFPHKELEFPEALVRVGDSNWSQEEMEKFAGEKGADSVLQLGRIPVSQTLREDSRWVIKRHPGPLDPGRVSSATGHPLDYSGKGLEGAAISAAVLADEWANGGSYWTEATVHFVTPDVKGAVGRIINKTKRDIPWATPSIKGWLHPIGIGVVWTRYQDELKHQALRVQEDLLPIEYSNIIAALGKFRRGVIPKGEPPREAHLINSGQGREYTLFMAKRLAVKLFPNG